MGTTLHLNVGRQRVTNVASPSESSYIRSIRAQMKVIEQNMMKVTAHIEIVTAEGIAFGLEPILKESQRLVPVDTGKLKRSGFIETRRMSGGTEAAIGYGRYGRPTYAAFVHENMNVRHAAPTQAKFLEVAVNTKIGDFGRRVALYMKRSMGDNSG